MRVTYAAHIVAGSLALLFGYVALYAAKGGRLHGGFYGKAIGSQL